MTRFVSVYKNDEYEFEDTIENVAMRLNVKVSTVQFYCTPTYHKRNKKGRKCYWVED